MSLWHWGTTAPEEGVFGSNGQVFQFTLLHKQELPVLQQFSIPSFCLEEFSTKHMKSSVI